jgi:glucosamine kinase
MALYLGIDGGGSGCRAAICDARGTILGEGRAGPANIASDPDTALSNLLAAAREALPEGAALPDLLAVLGMAGANVAECAAALQPLLPFARARIVTDARIALAGALQDRDGIVAATGTGTVYAIQRAGRFRQIGGWGLVLGDEGSGAWIGRTALAETLHAVDGLRAMTPLAAALLAEHGNADAIVRFAQTARPADFAALAPRIATSDDPMAAEIMGLAAGAVARSVARLQDGDPVPVVFLGGLGAVHADRLAGRWPMLPPRGSALEGALWMARTGA